MRTVGFVEAAAALAVAAVSETELKNELVVEYDEDETTTEPLPEITEDPATTENAAELEKPKRGRKKTEVSDESDSDG